jgi:hypothetical protein
MNFLWGFDPPDQACQVAKIIIMSQQCLAFFLSFLLSSSLFFFFLPSFLSFFLSIRYYNFMSTKNLQK